MTYHFDLNLWQILAGSAVFFFAAIGVALVCFCIIIDAFQIRFPLPVTAVDEPDVQPPSVESVESSVEVHVGEVIEAPREQLLPPAPVSLADAPIFASVPFTLPFTADFSFNWMQPWTLPTGEFPVIEAAEDERPKARERFATSKRKGSKRVTVDVGGDVRSEDMAVA